MTNQALFIMTLCSLLILTGCASNAPRTAPMISSSPDANTRILRERTEQNATGFLKSMSVRVNINKRF